MTVIDVNKWRTVERMRRTAEAVSEDFLGWVRLALAMGTDRATVSEYIEAVRAVAHPFKAPAASEAMRCDECRVETDALAERGRGAHARAICTECAINEDADAADRAYDAWRDGER